MVRAKKTLVKTRKKIDSIDELAVMVARGFADISGDISDFKSEMYEFRDEMYEFRDDIHGKIDVIQIELKHIRSEIAHLRERIERLEEQGVSHAGYAKEIDYILLRVKRIEEHLKIS